MTVTSVVKLPIQGLSCQEKQATVIPALNQDALLSVKQFADSGYTTIFHPLGQKVTVHDINLFKLTMSKPALLKGWRKAEKLWTVPLANDTPVSPSLNINEAAMSVYELPSMKEVVRFQHAALGFPTKAMLLTAIWHGNLITFPGLTTANITKYFPESDKTQKGHMKQTKQGVRST